jgi:hypothetical protein
MQNAPLPYERQPGETAKAYAAFQVYRDLGIKRSVDEVGKRLYGTQKGRKRGTTGRLRAWFTTWRWEERAAAWDDHLDQEARKAQEDARRSMAERHATMATSLQLKALERLQKMKPEELDASEVLRYLVEAAKLERLARGEPTEVSEQKITGTLTQTERTEFWIHLGQALRDAPEQKERVATLLRKHIESTNGEAHEQPT